MKWPLVSRRAFDIVLDERDRLRARNDELHDSMIRIQRVRHGMKEAPRPEPKPVVVQIPAEVRKLYAGFSEVHRRDLDRQCRQMATQGTPWTEIMRLLEVQMGGVN